jgi:competence protein ComGC
MTTTQSFAAVDIKTGACMNFAKRTPAHSLAAAFTRVELAAVTGACCIFLLLVLPLLANNSFRSNQVGCLNNLRQIGIGFQAWGDDHGDRRPWFVPMTEGGSMAHPLRNNAFLHYAFLSNYISPALLIDPAETATGKRVALNWSSSQGGFLNPGFKNNALSYMMGCHTTLAETHDILSGDRHIQFSGVASCSYGFSGVWSLNGSPFSFRGWSNGVHGAAGNLLFNDGRVEFTSSDRLRDVISGPDGPTSHFLSPF